ncbi:MAG: TetR/AcrR family transcriptional regulator [Myxococcales bacterium FL481]|nr:MAG: TetR/AcrR family transcriptional regulator [Myxococcales bacterium FL481]
MTCEIVLKPRAVTRRGSENFRESIISASVELGSQLGEDGLTMRGIASKLGVSATALYQHFDSKSAILREIRFHGVDRLWGAIGATATIDDPYARTVAIAERYLEFAIANPWLYTVLMEHEQVDWSSLDEAEMQRMIRPLLFVQETLKQGQRCGAWRGELDPEMGAFRLWTAVHGLSSLIINGRLDERHPVFPLRDGATYIRQFIHAVVASLGSITYGGG